jgi:TolB-like protein/Flp pilus assembly protein TadD
MLAGERPFNGPTAQAVLARRFTEVPRRISELRSGVPDNVDRALFKALSTDIGSRYKTSGLFAQALSSTSLVTPTDTETVPHLAVSAAKSVAVLPFANISADQENEYFADGMAEEIINALSKIQSLRVASRTSSFAFRGKNEDIGEIGRKLKVSTVLEGSVRRMGKRLRVTAELINVADGYNLWSERYDRELEDVFAIQDDISQAIVKALRAILTEGEKKAIEKARTTNVQAYDYYLRGRQYVHQWRRKSVEHARQMFNRAIEIDPEYALAYAGVADACSLLYTRWDPSEFNLLQADTASRKALELEPGLAEAHVARGIAISLKKEYGAADEEFETALRLDPKLFDAAYFYGRALKGQGRYAEAAKMFERATLLRPENFEAANFLAAALTDAGDEAEGEVARSRAIKLIEERLELNPDDLRATNLGAAILAKSGNRDGAIDYIRRSLEIEPEDANILYNIACAYSQLGMSDEALSSLKMAVDKGYADREWMEHDSDFASIRATPRFQAIAQAM